MYFNKNNNFFHGIMFHHFHDNKFHKKSQGSISKDDFFKIINFIGKENILDANIFFEKLKKNKLKNNEVCLTFDDSIKCQIDIALPILEELKIKSFFYVYSSIFEGNPDKLEIFRYFRTNYFHKITDFYDAFYQILDQDLLEFFKKNDNFIKKKIQKFQFYTIEDIKFRLVRDIYLNKYQYEKIMFCLMEEKKFKYKNFYKKLFFEKEDLIKLDNLGHSIGLHSHSHPTLMEKLNLKEQKSEYEKNLSIICQILNKSKSDIKSVSHPCGSYNNDTLNILKELKIELGFKNVMNVEKERGMTKENNSFLEIARTNHVTVLKEATK